MLSQSNWVVYFRNDIIRALDKTAMLGNISIVNGEYVCTVPLENNQALPELMEIAQKVLLDFIQHGFISSKLLKKVKGWEPADFYIRIQQLRKGGLLWVDKKTKTEPLFYFASHITDFELAKFIEFINMFS